MKIQLLSPEHKTIELKSIPAFRESDYVVKPFDERTIHFFDTLSKKILANTSINRLPEMVALAFWIRKANLKRIIEENHFLQNQSNVLLAPLGKVFHICPANVDTMFIYSLTVSVLMGNKNVLRISERMDAPQIQLLFQLLNEIMHESEFELFQSYINLISYGHDDTISTYISKQSNARIIWGGDNTINTFREFKPAPRTRDIIFADRVSAAIIDCNTFNELEDAEKLSIANKFFNDAYTFDQKGCSSPQSIYFIGDKVAFDNTVTKLSVLLSKISSEKYETDIASLASLKMNQMVDDTLNNTIEHRTGDNYSIFVTVSGNSVEQELHSCGGGYFYAKQLGDIAELKQAVTVKMQTISYFGLNTQQLNAIKHMAEGEGIDRIVPMGNALDFHYIWDGYNLLESLSRKVFIK